jgi:hypothetical protein
VIAVEILGVTGVIWGIAVVLWEGALVELLQGTNVRPAIFIKTKYYNFLYFPLPQARAVLLNSLEYHFTVGL